LSRRASQPLRVTLVTHYYPAHRGGVERVAGELARRLAAAGVARIEWHASDCDPAPEASEGVHAVPAASCNFSERRLGFPYPLWSPSALRRVTRACRSADVVHLHDCLYSGNLWAYRAARRAGRGVLVTQHIGYVPYRNPLLAAALRSANRWLGARVLAGADRVVFESESVRRYFSALVRYRAEPLLVQNGVDTETFHPVPPEARAALRAAFGASSGTPLLLFLGRFVEKKGLPLLRERTRRVPQARWVFGGWGPLDPGAWGRDNITVVRSPGAVRLSELYQAADLLVLPSVGEGFPLSVQEAMACGTPALIGTETAAGCPEGLGLLLAEPTGTPDSLERWSARLKGLTSHPSVLAALRPRVAEFASSQWSWERCVARYAEALRACVRGR
jgi:glycosyltransferase involved in cell wall biosynthesis